MYRLYRATAIICFSLMLVTAFGQKETSKWYFGRNAALDFSTGIPASLNNSAMNTIEGCASISDGTGNLLFYTNGVDIWNKNHVTMANGTSLIGHVSACQSSFIARKPGSSTEYYIFTNGATGLGTLAYSVVDMSLAAGLGSVTVKNATLQTNLTEKLHGTMHCNGSDVWVMVHKYNSNEFLAHLLTSSGVNTVSVVSAIGSVHAVSTNSTVSSYGYAGCLKFSPNGRKLAVVIVSPLDSVQLFDFNNATGQLSNFHPLEYLKSPYGCEFSPDGTKLYASQNGTIPSSIYQWDLCAGTNTNIQSSGQVISTGTAALKSIQLAQDNKIYVCESSMTSLSVINSPNLAGNLCNYTASALSLSTGTCQHGLPNHMSTSMRQKAVFSSTLTCGLASFSYTPPVYCATTGYSVNSVNWNFNDPGSAGSNTSTASGPQHNYTVNGNYTVTLLVHFPCYTDTLRQVINVNTVPNLTVTGKQNICKGDPFTLSASGANSYSWSTGSTSATLSAAPQTSSVYVLSGTNTVSGCSSSKQITVTVQPCSSLQGYGLDDPMRIYPNPNNGCFEVAGNFEIMHVYAITGELVATFKHETEMEYCLSEVGPGIYIFVNPETGGKTKIAVIK